MSPHVLKPPPLAPPGPFTFPGSSKPQTPGGIDGPSQRELRRCREALALTGRRGRARAVEDRGAELAGPGGPPVPAAKRLTGQGSSRRRRALGSCRGSWRLHSGCPARETGPRVPGRAEGEELRLVARMRALFYLFNIIGIELLLGCKHSMKIIEGQCIGLSK